MALKPEDKSTLEDIPPSGYPAVSDSMGSLRTPPGRYPILRIILPAGISDTIDRIRIDFGRRVSQPYGIPGGG